MVEEKRDILFVSKPVAPGRKDIGIQQMVDVLQSQGIKTESVTAEELIQRLRDGKHQAVIIDASVEDPTKLIKQARETSNLPIVFISWRPDWKLTRALFQAGISDIVKKDVDPNALVTSFKGIFLPQAETA